MLAFLLAVLAILSQPHQPPASFEQHMLHRGHEVYRTGFIGVEWKCSNQPGADETCFAGLDVTSLTLVTGS